MRVFRSMMVIVPLLLLIAGCTGTSYHPETMQKAGYGYKAIAIGPITARDDALWHSYAVLTRRALIADLIKSQAFAQVLDTVPHPLPADTVMVDGEITSFNKGSTALRWIIGFGAGSAQVVGHFRVSEPAGGIVLQFTTSKSYAGGAGMGGADLVDADSLARKLGEATAEAIVAWKKTGRLP